MRIIVNNVEFKKCYTGYDLKEIEKAFDKKLVAIKHTLFEDCYRIYEILKDDSIKFFGAIELSAEEFYNGVEIK